jgi:predicted CopG family antitoxin
MKKDQRIRLGDKFINPGDKVYDMLTALKQDEESYGRLIFRLIRNYEDRDMVAERITDILNAAKVEIVGTLTDGAYAFLLERMRVIILQMVRVPEVNRKYAMKVAQNGLDKILKKIGKLTGSNQKMLEGLK